MSRTFEQAVRKFSRDQKQYIEHLNEKMGASAIVLQTFDPRDDYKKDAGFLLQIALSIALDKPLYLLIPEGAEPPKKLKMIADGIEYYKPGDTESSKAATLRLMTAATGKSFPV